LAVKNGSDAIPTSVEARFDADGGLVSLAFGWHGQRFAIASWGRSWVTGDGVQQRQHFLVTTAGKEAFELTFAPLAQRWWVVRAGSRQIWV